MGTVDYSFPYMRLMDIGKRRGTVTITELNTLLPIDSVGIKEVGDVLDSLQSRGISIILSRHGRNSGEFHLLTDDRLIYPG